MKINPEKVNPQYRQTVINIENKPHVKYIRYLLSKMYSPIVIKKELQKLGLSAPHEKPLTIYYLAIMDPIIKHFGLSEIYASYKNKLLRGNSKRGEYSANLLNYRLTFSDKPDLQVRFQQFIKFIEIQDAWIDELYKFYGSIANFPLDENGNRVLSGTNSCRDTGSVEKILLCEQRYLIDKFLLENVPPDRIVSYCREKLKLMIQRFDLNIYKNMFFNVQTQTIEEKVEQLRIEKNSLETTLKDIENGSGEYGELGLGEKFHLIEQTKKRIEELGDNIKGLNALYTDAAVRIAEANNKSFEDMFADVVGRAYKRFTQLDGYKDRDVVDPLFKTARMMSFAHDKVEQIKSTAGGAKDNHSQSVLLELYSQRVDEIVEENKKRVGVMTGDDNFGNVSLDDIEGIGELGMAYEEEKSED